MKSSRLALVFLLVAAVAVAAATLTACGSDATEAPTDVTSAGATRTGEAAAGDAEVLEPDSFAVSGYAGKPLVVNFFGSWCGPCNAEAADLAAFAEANPDVQFVGIALNDSESDAVGFMGEYGLQYPLVVDDQRLAGEFGITGVPTTIFFDAQGQEKDRIVGAAGTEQFTASLAKAQ